MSTPQHRHRNASRGDVVARAAVVVGLAAAVGLLIGGAEPAAEFAAMSAACPAGASAALPAL